MTDFITDGNTTGDMHVDSDEEYWKLELLPPDLREALNNAPVNMAVSDVFTMYMNDVPVEDILTTIRNFGQQIVEHIVLETYGPDHPQAPKTKIGR